jgi:superfamily II DNA or RNA helicase
MEHVTLGRLAWLRLDEVGPRLSIIQQNLTIVPKATSMYSKPTTLRLWEEDLERGLIGVPREWFLANRRREYEFSHDHAPDVPAFLSSSFAAGEKPLRDEQRKALAAFLRAFREDGKLGGILQAPTGWGKTVMTLALLAEMRLRALVLVHKEFLMSQWEERALEFLPGVRVGRIQGDRCDTDVDICFGMIQSLSQREYPPEAYRAFSVVVTDETHRTAAVTWSSVIPKFHARLRFGITATPRRKDLAENAFFWHIGPILFRARHLAMEPAIRWIRTGFSFVQVPGKPSMEVRPRAVQLRVICANDHRNKLIAEEMAQAVAHGRKVMVLSERLNHLHRLARLFDSDPRCKGASWAYYVGGMAEEALEEATKARVLFATVAMAQEGLDIPDLDTLMLVMPMSDPEQAVGRILRSVPGKQQPIVVDFVDEVGWCERMAERRAEVYARLRALAAATPPAPRPEPPANASLTGVA